MTELTEWAGDVFDVLDGAPVPCAGCGAPIDGSEGDAYCAYCGPLVNGRTVYTVTVAFSGDYEGLSHPENWDWRGLLAAPDARLMRVTEHPNPGYGGTS